MKSKEKTSTKQDILQYLLKHGSAIAHQLAEHLDISVQAIRRHLKDLEHEGLVIYHVSHPDEHPDEQDDEVEDQDDFAEHGANGANGANRTNSMAAHNANNSDNQDQNNPSNPSTHHAKTAMGRPQHVYELSKAGRDRFPANYDQFSVNLLDTLAETLGKEQVSEILHKQWLRKAMDYRQKLGSGSLRDRVAHLAELRRSEGYVAEWFEQDPHDQGDQPNYILTEYNCAISEVAESFPSICSHELEMFEAALEGCKVERTHWMVGGEHRCGYLISSNRN
ncbi:iron-sulfur cluster biosynthesis transcriptional regulator SufR [Thalassoporum mexicanum PCC 7367]|uniref:iron-sulfur cluster biosynthesis transcriptional regulator SufR n=1 Tax=Thalassoporum mexicanum TaxID=3457544 RepID=UPI00029FD7EA|nr:iron-sulfur cluster biosynthesis transcriptional regulator SufR [Pseudanabaena sp. PCC 7367]AFY70208.1 iron-sulfur cluster biosynthesis transcriptional regulator SufR [Pseudanabaena sp. PCC 7367]